MNALVITEMQRLGRFHLLKRVGSGGAATVWRAEHIDSGRAAAVKILRPEGAEAAAFEREVRAVAGLNHPAIVKVFDYGQVGPGEALGIADQGSHYLAMEYARDGTLQQQKDLDWPRLGAIVADTLSGLAHAHARGVIHRDIKPANLLLTDPANTGVRVRVTDFGIAQVVTSEDAREERFVGTARYSAPEQYTAEWREHGPWTDLYALGCLVWEAVCGATPFDGSFIQLMHQHLVQEPPEFRPQISVPGGLEAWLRKLLQKRIESRYRFAADARRALLQLGQAQVSSSSPVAAAFGDDEPTLRGSTSGPISETVMAAHGLPGAGLGLYSLRIPPFVGRQDELGALTRQLDRVTEEWLPRVAVLRGPSGVGKSRLARNFAESSHERGAALHGVALHGANSARGSVLPLALAQLVGCQRLSTDRVQVRLSRLFGPGQEEIVLDVADLLSATSELGADRVTTPELRHAACIHLLRALSEQQPVVLVLDDVQWDDDSIALAEAVMAAPPGLRLFVVCTVQDEGLAQRPASQDALANLVAHDLVEEITVGALTDAEHAQFVAGLLPLREDLKERVCELTRGNPLFAVQLIGDWVEQAAIRPAAGGFELVPGAELRLPDSLHGVWLERLKVFDEYEMQALEIAACISAEVDNDLWGEACLNSGLPLEATTLMRLMRLRLAVMTDGGWNFVHAMLSNSLRRRAADAGRLADHHRRLSDAILDKENNYLPETLSRSAWHLVQAGRLADAEVLLWRLLELSETRGDTAAVQNVAERLRQVLNRLSVPPGDPRREQLALIHGVGLSHASEPRAALPLLEMVTEAVGTARYLRAQTFIARCWYQLGRVEEARGKAEAVMKACEDAGLMHRWAETAVHRAYMAVKRHETPKIQEWLILAMRRTDDPVVRASACSGVAGLTELKPSAIETALVYLQTAQAELARVAGRPLQQGRTVRLEGALRFHLGQYDAAISCLRDAEVQFHRGGLDSPINTALLCVSLAMGGRMSDAVVHAHRALKRENNALTESWVGMCYTVLALDAVQRGDLQTWELMMDARPRIGAAEDQAEPEVQVLLEAMIPELQHRCVHRAARALGLLDRLRSTLH